MRALKIAFLWLLGLFIASLLALVIFIKFYDFNRHKPAIIAQAKTLLGRDMDFDRIAMDISFAQGLSLKIKDLRIAEDPSIDKGDFLSVKEISLGISLMSYIFQRRINILKVLIDSPKITIIRLKDGGLNAAALARNANQGGPENSPGRAKDQKGAAPAAGVPDISVSFLRIDGCSVKYIDRSVEPALSLDIPDLYVSVSNISLTDPFPFIVEAAFLSKNRNIKLEGRAQFNAAAGEVTVSGLKAGTDLSDIKIDKIPEVFPAAKGAVLPELLEGIIEIRFDPVTVGPKGAGALKAEVAAAKGIVQYKELVAPVKNIAVEAVLTQSDVILDNAYFTVGTGMAKFSGFLKDHQAKQSYSAAGDIEGMKIQNLLDQKKSPVKVEGIVSGQVKVQGEGISPESLKSGLSAAADMLIARPKLKDLNVLRAVLDKISIIPGISQSIEAGLPERFRQKLVQQDTSFSDIKLPLSVEKGLIVIKDVTIAGDEFTFRGRVESGFDAAYSLEGSFLIEQELSAAIVAAVPQIQYLLDESGRIFIPLKVSGKAGQVDFKVDAVYIGKRLLENQAKQQIFKALDNSAVKDTVSSVLGNIFKK
jgi:hypothetical protein